MTAYFTGFMIVFWVLSEIFLDFTPNFYHCPVLIASTGFNLEADKAGIIPDSKPTENETPNPINTLADDNTKVKSSTTLEAN